MITFSIDGDVLKDHDKWLKKHNKKCKGSVIYSFTHASGIGISAVVYCPSCKANLDITDYGEW